MQRNVFVSKDMEWGSPSSSCEDSECPSRPRLRRMDALNPMSPISCHPEVSHNSFTSLGVLRNTFFFNFFYSKLKPPQNWSHQQYYLCIRGLVCLIRLCHRSLKKPHKWAIPFHWVTCCFIVMKRGVVVYFELNPYIQKLLEIPTVCIHASAHGAHALPTELNGSPIHLFNQQNRELVYLVCSGMKKSVSEDLSSLIKISSQRLRSAPLRKIHTFILYPSISST